MDGKTKVHWCSGDIYLKGYANFDIAGILLDDYRVQEYKLKYPAKENEDFESLVDISRKEIINPNETTLDNYYKYPFGSKPRPFLLDMVHNILKTWPFDDASIDELVMISCIEHFDPASQLPHIFKEINRCTASGSKLIVDFPDIKKQVELHYGKNDEFLMELLYCNHKNVYSIHHWGFTVESFKKWLGDGWNVERNDIVKHSYPMIGVECTKL